MKVNFSSREHTLCKLKMNKIYTKNISKNKKERGSLFFILKINDYDVAEH